MKIVIVGGVAGGASAAARLRRLREDAEIILLEKGDYVSFANCGLPYYIGGVIREKSNLTLQTPQSFYQRFRIDVRIKNEAVKIDAAKKQVTVKNLLTGKESVETYDALILSPGASPIRPPIPGSDLDHVFTLRAIPDAQRIKEYIQKHQPQTAVVVGGGYIGVETAENLKEAGLSVSIVEKSDHLIASLDADMAAEIHAACRENGISLSLSNGVKSIEKSRVVLEKGELPADLVLLSVGVRPDTGWLKDSGIMLNDRGSICVNEQMQTNLPGVYAVGDAIEVKNYITGSAAFLPLAGPANKQGRIAADVICEQPDRYSGTQGSAVLKLFDRTVASTGLNEKAAVQAGFEYDKTYLYSANHATYYPGGTNMSIKILWDKKTLRLLGAQIVGFAGVDKRMDVLATAIHFGARVTDLASLELCYAPPFGSAKDPINMAGFVAENIITGKMKQFFPENVAALPRDGSVTLLDVRTKQETRFGMIDGFINIPLDDLRENLALLPKDKPVYIHCHSGLRSYIACRILTGYGYDCCNLAGGWRLYRVIQEDAARR